MFYAPWCGYCKEMKPSYAEAAKALKMENSKIVLAALDATKYRELSEKEEIKGYPTCNTAFVVKCFYKLRRQVPLASSLTDFPNHAAPNSVSGYILAGGYSGN